MSSPTTPVLDPAATRRIGTLEVTPFPHPQGCRSYLLADPKTRQALGIDPHLDLVEAMADAVRSQGLSLVTVIDTHTHADHPSGSAALASRFSAERAAHSGAGHAGVTRPLAHGDELVLGSTRVGVRHAPGHTPDHVVLLAEGALFSGDTLLIGGVARTDFLGGDAGRLFDTIHGLLADLPGETIVLPAHDYKGRISSTLDEERSSNPWLAITDRTEFVKALTANPPPRPANMDDLLRLNREGMEIPAQVGAARAIELAGAGGAGSIIDVRTPAETQAEAIPGSRLIPLDEIGARIDEVRAAAAPRLILCRSGARAERARQALEAAGVRGLQVIEGGLEAWRTAGGATRRGTDGGRRVMSLERQVRIAAGVLVLVGLALALLHPAFLLLSAFVGAGLAWSGITDQCGMALVLTRLPWNRGSAGAAGSCSTGLPAGGCAAPSPPSAGGTCAASPPPPVTAGGTCAASPPPPPEAGGTCAASPPPPR